MVRKPTTPMPHLTVVRLLVAREQEHERQEDQPRDLEEVQQLAPADDVHREEGEHDPPGQAAQLLERLTPC